MGRTKDIVFLFYLLCPMILSFAVLSHLTMKDEDLRLPWRRKQDTPEENDESKTEKGEFISLDEIERETIEKAYFFADRNASEAAKLIGISRATMYRKLKKLGYES